MFDIVEMRYVMPIPTDAGDEILLNFHECMSLHISFNYFEVDSMSSEPYEVQTLVNLNPVKHHCRL